MNELIKPNKDMIEEIVSSINQIKTNIVKQIVSADISAKWIVGKIIVSNEDKYNNRLEYGKEILKGLSDELTKYLGRGYSVTNLKYMRMFYKAYPNIEEVSSEMNWAHYLELMVISDKDKRAFYEKEIINNHWDAKELKR